MLQSLGCHWEKLNKVIKEWKTWTGLLFDRKCIALLRRQIGGEAKVKYIVWDAISA